MIHSERELNKGYAALHLEPFLARYPDVRYGYVIEIQYLKRGETADESAVAARLPKAADTPAPAAAPWRRTPKEPPYPPKRQLTAALMRRPLGSCVKPS